MSPPEQPQPKLVKRIVCLANSRKLSGRCIVGREIVNDSPGAWIRPVSAREHQEVSWEERHYEDGSDPSVLDVVAVPLLEPRPHQFQQENWLLDPTFYWRKTGRMDWAGLQDFVEPEGPLWVNGQHTGRGLNDRISMKDAERLRSSLRLVRINSLTIDVSCPGAAFGNPKRRLQGQFQFPGVWYHLRVTDPVYERRFLALPDGQHRLGESCLAISLGEPFEGYAYKLIAAIIERSETGKA
ncbi:MAG: hypothetical protein O2960_17670 [Verrucomicrobia bacterium]|nr:hypothetical protein [Verrucomicrobiota bacterium]